MNLPRNNTGSILIWVVLLGTLLTSAFFFTAIRLNKNALLQRDTIAVQNERAFFESAAAYYMAHPSEQTAIDLDGITGSLTRQTDAIEGFLDSGASITYPNLGQDAVTVSWNECAKNQKADLEWKKGTDAAVRAAHQTPSCNAATPGYADTTPAISGLSGSSFTLSAPAAPFYYKIVSATAGQKLTDARWHLSLRMTGSNGQIWQKLAIFSEAP